MILDAKDKFLFKRANDKGAEKLYERYLEINKGNGNNICETSVCYLKAFVEYSPNICLKIIRSKDNDQLSLNPWGEDYLYLLTSIAAYHLDRNEKAIGLIWALKALNVFDFFLPTLKKDNREKILYEMVASSMVCAYPNDFRQVFHNDFMLDWEVKRLCYSGHKIYFNDNKLNESKP